MSRSLISRSDDLRKLEADGYEVAIKANHLVLSGIPYVTSAREVRRDGVLISVLELDGNRTRKGLSDHKAMFAGGHPCDQNGVELMPIKHSSNRKDLGGGLIADHMFSAKPPNGYQDYYEKMTAYAERISGPARKIDPDVTARTFVSVVSDEDDSPFLYRDTASTRAGIGALSDRLKQSKIAIVGLGGTGSYLLDLVAKTPVREIHLFDGDDFCQHNAFRAPGAAALEDFSPPIKKVAYWKAQYERMRRGIDAHPYFLDASNASELDDMDFIFVCVDSAAAKRPVLEHLVGSDRPFIDVGMGVQLVDDRLLGVVRTTFSPPEQREHIGKLLKAGEEVDELYSKNIQITDLNALNAVLAVMRWKKHVGFYLDLEEELESNYTIDGNHITRSPEDE